MSGPELPKTVLILGAFRGESVPQANWSNLAITALRGAGFGVNFQPRATPVPELRLNPPPDLVVVDLEYKPDIDGFSTTSRVLNLELVSGIKGRVVEESSLRARAFVIAAVDAPSAQQVRSLMQGANGFSDVIEKIHSESQTLRQLRDLL